MKALLSPLIWLPALFVTLIVKAIGLIVVIFALLLKTDMRKLPIWGNPDGIPASFDGGFWKKWVWYAWRNGANAFNFGRAPGVWRDFGGINESLPGFQWRWRQAGWLSSFRLAWGKPDPRKGKNEFYIGWVMNDAEEFLSPTAQLRPAWLILIPLLAWWVFS